MIKKSYFYLKNNIGRKKNAILIIEIISSFCPGEFIHRVKKQIEQHKLTKSQEGWILIDSIIGMVILSTAVIALLGAFTQATRGTAVSTNRTQATYLAQQALENLKAQDGNASIDTTVVISPVMIPPAVGITYTVIANPLSVSAITNDGNQLSEYLKPYQVTVTWSDTSGGPTSNSVKMVGYCYVNP